MDDQAYGTRDKRGNWTPKDPLTTAPIWSFPPDFGAILKWLPGYFLPWNVLFMATATLFWVVFTPGPETLKTLSWGWTLGIFARNCIAVLIFYGIFELRLYIQRKQGTAFKYNPKFPQDTPNDAFLFKSQNAEGLIRTFVTGIPAWTAYEVLVLWVFANGWVPSLSWSTNPVWLVCFGLILPLFHQFHFYLVHRLIHVPVLYKYIHSVHHNSVNPSPWSSLSMHPIEHILYFSGVLIHLIVPSNPLLAIYQLHIAGLGAVVGHIGFDKMETVDEKAMNTHAFAHYLHHKYFEVNYADGGIPLDRMFGTFHDGTKAGDALMDARTARRNAKANAGKT